MWPHFTSKFRIEKDFNSKLFIISICNSWNLKGSISQYHSIVFTFLIATISHIWVKFTFWPFFWYYVEKYLDILTSHMNLISQKICPFLIFVELVACAETVEVAVLNYKCVLGSWFLSPSWMSMAICFFVARLVTVAITLFVTCLQCLFTNKYLLL